MADWELFAGLVFAVAALITWAPWYADIFRVNRFAASRGYRALLGLAPIFCLAIMLLCLQQLAPKVVRENGLYILVYLAIGAGAVGIAAQLFPLLGISPRDDVLERRNPAAFFAILGALLGTALCVIGGNIGEGPGVEAVLASAGTAVAVWFLLWYLLEILSGHQVSERVTIDRDVPSALRIAGLLVANGIILGVAAAGDWMPGRFLRDFAAAAWPTPLLTGVAAALERGLKSAASTLWSVAAPLGYLLAALLWALHVGLRT